MHIGRREIGFRRSRFGRGMFRQRQLSNDDYDYGRAGPRMGRRTGSLSWVPILLVIWLIIGAIAAGQRGYFTDGSSNCASTATTLVTVVAGPLNYLGANPRIADCNAPDLPQPSQ